MVTYLKPMNLKTEKWSQVGEEKMSDSNSCVRVELSQVQDAAYMQLRLNLGEGSKVR